MTIKYLLKCFCGKIDEIVRSIKCWRLLLKYIIFDKIVQQFRYADYQDLVKLELEVY